MSRSAGLALLVGVPLGLLVSRPLSTLIAPLLFRTGAWPLSSAIAATGICALALVAAAWPSAHRVARLNPADALR